MKEARKISPFGLRLAAQVKERAQEEANRNRRSLNTELGLLIEEGFKWREQQAKHVAA